MFVTLFNINSLFYICPPSFIDQLFGADVNIPLAVVAAPELYFAKFASKVIFDCNDGKLLHPINNASYDAVSNGKSNKSPAPNVVLIVNIIYSLKGINS